MPIIMAYDRLVYRVHAIQRMLQRRISQEIIHKTLQSREVIEDNPEDKPYPSRLILGSHGSRPIHVLAADNQDAQETIIITAYEPDPKRWEPGFKRRKKR